MFDLPEPDTVAFQAIPGGVELFPHFNPANPTEASVVTTASDPVAGGDQHTGLWADLDGAGWLDGGV